MLKYFIKRVLSLIPMLLVISILIFILLDLTPGDPLTHFMSPDLIASMSTEQLDDMREAYGLNDPAPVRYLRWLGNILKGDLGRSISNGAPISQIFANLLPSTLKLSLAALVISTVLGLLFGILAAIYQDSIIDYICSIFGIIGISFPEFFVGICFIQIFAIKLGWFPAQGRVGDGLSWFQNLRYIVLPSCALGFSLTAALMRYARSSMLEVLNKDYIKTAWSKGLSARRVYMKHAFRNALMPIVLVICLRLPMLVGGSVVIETVFSYSGIGQKLVDSINAKDYTVVMMVTLVLTAITLLASVLLDLLTAALDPRMRLDSKRSE